MTDDPLLGTQLDEYRLEKLLGRGGMARVYLGLDTRLGRYAAIKVIDSPLRTHPEYIRQFEKEAQAIARLEHPHIVRLYRYGEAQDLLYMAMQYIEGVDLRFVLKTYRDEGALIEPAEASRIIRQTCLALDYAHAEGVIHRDIKPSNILLDKQGQVYLADFGVALFADTETPDTMFGSPQYIAPEQVMSVGVVPESDLYSVGVILYEMFTGRPPFIAETTTQFAHKHVSEMPPPPHDLRAEIALELSNVILKTLAKEPHERYANGAALADALDRALRANISDSLASTVPHQSVPERIALGAEALEPSQHPSEVASPLPDAPPPLPVAPPSLASSGDIQSNHRAISLLALITAGLSALCLTIATIIGVAALLQGNDTGTTLSTLSTGTSEASPSVSAGRPVTQTPPFTMTSVPRTLSPQLAEIAPTSPADEAIDYVILIIKQGEDSVFVLNQGQVALPLGPLRLGEGQGFLIGDEWGLKTLEPGQCVAVWNASGNPQPPKVDCTLVGNRLTRESQDRFWVSTFKIVYGKQIETVCSSDWCSVTRLRNPK